MQKRKTISVAIPVYESMENGNFFLERCIESIESQSFKDYEIVITRRGKMAENTNNAIRESKGKLIKILYQDDFLCHENSLKDIVENFDSKTKWLVTGCLHDDGKNRGNPHMPTYSNDVIRGINTIGSPSVLTIRNNMPMLFDESMKWALDVDYYKRMYDSYGPPKILNTLNVVIGIGDHQATNNLSDFEKMVEQTYLTKKHDTTK